jgi:cholesterol transport system auxiliary component
MSDARLGFAACAALVLAGCSIGKPIPQANTYVVQAPVPERTPSVASRTESVRIGKVRVAAAYAGNALVYRMDDVRLVSDPYSRFIAEPGAMLADQMAEWLRRAGPFSTVTDPESTLPAHYVLEATVTELYGDFRPGRAPAAVLAVQFALIDQTRARPQPVFERALARRVDLPRASPDDLVRGYGDALAEILGELSSELQAIPKPSAATVTEVGPRS